MSTCCWCTPGGVSTVDFLQRYASKSHSSEFQTADEDLCYCLECVAEYHKARDDLPFLHEVIYIRWTVLFRAFDNKEEEKPKLFWKHSGDRIDGWN